ncbi:MAG: DNA internalization-related competence protein ComEC/Rec2 [Candidatus Brocadiaceae bacterium]
MQRPIVFITLVFICGICLAYLIKIPIYFTLGMGFLVWVFCLVCLCSHNKFAVCTLPCLSVLILVTSVAYYNSRTNSLENNDIEHLLTTRKTLQRIRGVITNPPIILDETVILKRLNKLRTERFSKKSGYKISFTLRAEAIETIKGWQGISGSIKINLYPSKEESFESNTLPLLHKLVYGQRVELFGHAFIPKSPTNPGEFNYKTYLQRQMPTICCLMTIVNTDNIKIRASHHGNSLYNFLYALNNWLNNTIYTHTFSSSAPLISSMLLGNRVDLSGETIDNFMKTGIIHFIAISGFNVGIVVFTILLPLRLLGVNQTITTGIILMVISLFAFLTGMNPPVLRASIMAIAFFCSFLVRRQWDIMSGIFAAIFFILIRNPLDLFDVGFQLSVLATIGIVIGTSKIEGTLFKTALIIESLQVKAERGRFYFLKKYIRKSLCVSLAAWLATLPLTAYYFHLFTPFIPVVNIIVFPLFWIIIVCGIVLLTLGICCPPLAAAAAWMASNADALLESLVSTLASLPYSYFYVIGPSWAGIVLFYAFILLLLYGKRFALNPRPVVIWGLLSANILIFSDIVKQVNRPLAVTCLDVGHGGALFIQFPNGKNILYDVGSWQNFDAGRYIVAPYLWGKHIKKIDLVILSHEHEDHWNGLASLTERFSIHSVCSQPHFFTSETGKKILDLLEGKHIQTVPLSSGEVLAGFEPAIVKILNPPPFHHDISTINDNSCVLKIEYLGHSILLCADIEEQGIETLLSKAPEIRSDIIQIPHHGSSIDNLDAFIRKAHPLYAFINSCDNITSPKTLDILRNQHIQALLSHRKGAITFKVDQTGITYDSFNE